MGRQYGRALKVDPIKWAEAQAAMTKCYEEAVRKREDCRRLSFYDLWEIRRARLRAQVSLG